MKEKRYILPDEKTDAAFAAEPTPVYHGNAALVLPADSVDECDDDDIDWEVFIEELKEEELWLI